MIHGSFSSKMVVQFNPNWKSRDILEPNKRCRLETVRLQFLVGPI